MSRVCRNTAFVRVSPMVFALGLLAGTGHADDQGGVSARFHVGPNGRDTWSGTLESPNAAGTDGPFATIVRARDAVRRLRTASRPTAPIVVLLHAGRYVLTEPLIFDPEDSGTAQSPTIYAAAPGDEGRVVMSGGRTVTGWKPARGARGEWVADVPGLEHGWRFRHVTTDGLWRDRPRLPDGETATYTIAGLAGADANAAYDTPADRFEYAPGQFDPGWTMLRDVEVVVPHFWIDSHHKLARVEPDHRVVQLDRPSRFKFTDEHQPVPGRYYIANVYEALGPGRFYANSRSGTLHYMPRAGESTDRVHVVVPRLTSLIEFRGVPGSGRFVDNLAFQDLTLADTAWEPGPGDAMDAQAAGHVPGAVIATGARHVTIERCVLKNLGGYGIDLRDGCRGVRLAGNELAWIAAGGIKVNGAVDPEPRRTGETIIVNNRLHHLGRLFHSGVGVLIMNSFGNTVAHNEISDLYYTAVSVGWVWGYGPSVSRDNRIEFNHIHHVGHGLLSDLGGVYTLGRSSGTVVRNNIVHHVEGHDKGWGLYTDEGSTGILLENNLVYRTSHGSFHQHYGRDNIVRNNIFAFGRDAQIVRSRDEPHRSFAFEHNIVYYRTGDLFSSVWSGGADHFTVDHNLYWNAGGSPPRFPAGGFQAWQALGFDKHSIVADPRFLDPDHDDFHLKPDSPARPIGFQPIDLSSVGPSRLTERVSTGNPARYAAGPLRVDPENARYFTDGGGRAIYLTGSHTWANLQDQGPKDLPPKFDYVPYLDFLREHNHNFIRLWAWEQARWAPWSDGKGSNPSDWFVQPNPYARTGPGTALDGKARFNLDAFDESYFERLRSRVQQAGDRGIYVSVMLFQGWSAAKAWLGGKPWRGHPYHPDNNIQGWSGNRKGNTGPDLDDPRVRERQAAYVRKVVDTLNDLDNVLYEVTNEGGNKGWDRFVVDLVHDYEKTKTKRHPVGLTGHGSESNDEMLASPADWFSPGSNDWPDLKTDPRAAPGKKVSLLDTDHVFGVGGDQKWVWKSFMRGHNVLFMDPYDDPAWAPILLGQGVGVRDAESARRAMGHTRAYAMRIDLTVSRPAGELASTGYCLAVAGREYLIYLPDGGATTVNLADAKGKLSVEWMHPMTGKITAGEAVDGGKRRTFKAPFYGDTVLYLRKMP